jgi:hypothetical protein
MRLWHLLYGILAMALVLTLARDPAGRVGVIVFITGLGEATAGTVAALALFQTIGALGEARSLYDHAEALLATTVVLAFSSSVMGGVLFIGAWCVSVAVA